MAEGCLDDFARIYAACGQGPFRNSPGGNHLVFRIQKDNFENFSIFISNAMVQVIEKHL